METMKRIAQHTCDECPAVRQNCVEEDAELKEIMQYPKEVRASEFAYSCFKRTHLVCKGLCDQLGIDQSHFLTD